MAEVVHDSTNTERTDSTTPLLSVIVPVCNSPTELNQCLAALAKSHFEDFEVWVVDDGSTVAIKPLADAYGFAFTRIHDSCGPACARNRGVEKARGRYVLFIDADVCVHDNTLALFAESFGRDPTVDAVVGSYDEAPACPNFISQYKNLFHHYVHQNSRGEIQTFWSGCGAMKRDLFLAFGGYDQQRYRRPAVEDIELGMRVAAAGHHIILDARIKAKHLKRWTFWNLLRTDVFNRGIPWTRLILRSEATICTLNVTPVQRLSVGLVYLTLLGMLTAALEPTMVIAAAATALIVTLLNLDFYRFYLKRRGLWFTLRVVPMHWLYFLCCGISVVGGTLLLLLEQDRTKLASDPPTSFVPTKLSNG
jgi:glycosyltransferase involved in cell wall biosynthesis